EKAVSPKATSAAPSAAAKAATDPPPAGGSGAAAPALRKAVIGDFGLDLSAGNRNVKPGDDFYACANGAWYDSFAIPPDHSSYGAFDQLDELSKKRVREIIEQAAAARTAAGTPEQQIGDYYAAFMDDPQLKELRAKYVAYIEQMLTLGGVSDAKALAHEIMTFETAASKVQWPIEKRRDVDATYNPRSKEQLLAFAPGFPWQPFFEAMQLGARQDLVLGELSAIRDMAELFGRTSVPTLRGFLTFH